MNNEISPFYLNFSDIIKISIVSLVLSTVQTASRPCYGVLSPDCESGRKKQRRKDRQKKQRGRVLCLHNRCVTPAFDIWAKPNSVDWEAQSSGAACLGNDSGSVRVRHRRRTAINGSAVVSLPPGICRRSTVLHMLPSVPIHRLLITKKAEKYLESSRSFQVI